MSLLLWFLNFPLIIWILAPSMSQFLKRQIRNKQQKLCKKLARLTFFFINGGLSASLSLFSTSKAQDFHVYEAILKICSRCGRTSRTKCAALVILTISWKASDHHQKLFKAVNICNKEEFLWNWNFAEFGRERNQMQCESF